jgi:hypothetical protein
VTVDVNVTADEVQVGDAVKVTGIPLVQVGVNVPTGVWVQVNVATGCVQVGVEVRTTTGVPVRVGVKV